MFFTREMQFAFAENSSRSPDAMVAHRNETICANHIRGAQTEFEQGVPRGDIRVARCRRARFRFYAPSFNHVAWKAFTPCVFLRLLVHKQSAGMLHELAEGSEY